MSQASEQIARQFANANVNKNTWGTILYNVKAYGAVGDGVTDDTASCQAAIAAAKAAGGGIVFIPKGKFKITSTLTIDNTISIQGAGSDSTNMDTTTALTDAVSAIVWAGGASTIINITGMVGGVDWRDFVIDGANLASIGINIDQLRNSTWSNVKVIRCTTGVKMLPVDNGVSDRNTMFNVFTNLAILRCGVCLDLNGTGLSNVCHNTFIHLSLDSIGTDCLLMNDADNNMFMTVYGYLRGATGFSARFQNYCRSNYFFHFEGSIKAESGSNNIVFAFDRENGQPRPTVDAGAKLFWTENGNNALAWHMTSAIEAVTTLVSGDNTLSINSSADPTAQKLFRPDTSQLLQWAMKGSDRTATMTYYDGTSPAECFPLKLDGKGIQAYQMGGATITYSGTNTIPTGGTYNQGDYVKNNAPTILGTAGGRYVIKGWNRITTGAAHVLNADWTEDRALTGT